MINLTSWTIGGLVIALAFGGAPRPTAATTYIRAQTAAYDQNTGYNVSDSGQIAGPHATAESGPITDYGGTFHSKAFADWTGGSSPTLGVLSEMTNTYPLYQSFTPAQAWWSLTFTPGGAPAGTQVSYSVGLYLHDNLSSTIYPGFPNNLGAQAVVDYTGTGALSGFGIHDNSLAPASNHIVWSTITLTSGQSVTLGATMASNATAQGGEATADAFSTGYFALRALTPGATYTTDNGVVFLSSFDSLTGSVPEPSTWAMMILGFAGVGFMTYRRRNSAMLAA